MGSSILKGFRDQKFDTLKTEKTLGDRTVVTGGGRERMTNSGDEAQTTAASRTRELTKRTGADSFLQEGRPESGQR